MVLNRRGAEGGETVTTNRSATLYRANEEQLLFEALRHEFILERDVEPPFCPAPQEHRVPENFAFGRYLSISLGQFVAHAVELDNWTLKFFVLATIIYYTIDLMIEEELHQTKQPETRRRKEVSDA